MKHHLRFYKKIFALLFLMTFSLAAYTQVKLPKSTGTAMGASSYPLAPTVVGNTVFFGASDDEGYSWNLWKTDGTPEGTTLVKEFTGDTFLESGLTELISFNGQLFFTATDGLGIQLWKSDGTAAGTLLVKGIQKETTGGVTTINPPYLSLQGNNLYFGADDGTGYKLWKSDGTGIGTIIAEELAISNNRAFSPRKIGNALYFSANDGAHGYELWKLEDNAGTPVMVKDLTPGTTGSEVSYIQDINGVLVFTTRESVSGASATKLWKSDGTADGTVMVQEFEQEASLYSSSVVGDTFFFSANDGTGDAVWKYSIASGSVEKVKVLEAPGYFTSVSGVLYFVSGYISGNYSLWRSDGTEQGTIQLKSGAGHIIDYLAPYGDGLLFTVTIEEEGYRPSELWITDGAESGTRRILQSHAVYPNYSGSGFNIKVQDQDIYAAASDAGNQIELWKYTNQLPTSSNTNASITATQSSYTFATGDFVFADANESDELRKIKITELPAPAQGILYLKESASADAPKVAVALNQEIRVEDLARVELVPAARVVSFSFKVSDGIAYSAGDYTFILHAPGAPLTVPQLSWANTIQSPEGNKDYINSIAQGPDEFLYAAGTNYAVSVSGMPYLAKYSKGSNQQWILNFVGNSVAFYKVAVTSGNEVIVLGYSTNDDFDYDSGIGEVKIPSINDGGTTFIAKYDQDGKFLWVKAIRGTGAAAYPSDLKLDSNDNIYINGSFAGTVDFDPNGGVAELIGRDDYDVFFAKYTAEGNYVWSKQIGGKNREHPIGLEVDAEQNVYLSGYFSSAFFFADTEAYTANIDKTDPTTYVGIQPLQKGVSTSAIFLSKYDRDGNYVWTDALVPTEFTSDYTLPVSMKLDKNNSIYLTGIFASKTDFNPITSEVYELDVMGEEEAFLAKYNVEDGAFIWAKSIGGGGDDYGLDVGVDEENNVHLVGTFEGSVEVGTGTTLVSNGLSDIFYTRFTSDGTLISAFSIGGNGYDAPNSLLLGDKMYIAGRFESTVDFDLGSGTSILTAGSDLSTTAAFLVAYGEAPALEELVPVNWPATLTYNESATFAVEPVTGATSYTWTVPADFEIVGDATGHTVTVKAISGIASGNIKVEAIKGTEEIGEYSAPIAAVKAVQEITFAAMYDVTFGVEPLVLSASANSGLDITYTVTGPAEVVEETGLKKLRVTGAGPVVTVTALQNGNNNYAAAESIARSFAVEKATAIITVENTEQEYNGMAKQVMVSTIPAGLAVSVTYNGFKELPTAVDTYDVVVTVQDDNYKGQQLATLNILAPTGMKQELTSKPLIYPNPAEDVLCIELPMTSLIQVTALNGQVLFRQEAQAGKFILDVSSLQEGVYLLQAITGAGSVTTRFMKK